MTWGPGGVRQVSWAHGVWVEGGVEAQGSPLDTNAVCELLSASGLGPPDIPARVWGGGSHKGPQGLPARPGPSPSNPVWSTCAGGNQPCSAAEGSVLPRTEETDLHSSEAWGHSAALP